MMPLSKVMCHDLYLESQNSGARRDSGTVEHVWEIWLPKCCLQTQVSPWLFFTSPSQEYDTLQGSGSENHLARMLPQKHWDGPCPELETLVLISRLQAPWFGR